MSNHLNQSHILRNKLLNYSMLFLCIFLPNIYALLKFFDPVHILGYTAAIILYISIILKWSGHGEKNENFPDYKRLAIMCLPVIILVCLFLALYPIANQQGPYAGSDDEDCINGALSMIFRGEDPYAFVSYLGNLLNVLPGTLIISVPFVLMGNAAYQNIFWILLYGLFLFFWTGKSRLSVMVFWMFCLSPGLVQQLVTGVEHVSNAIYVMLGAVAYYYSVTKNTSLTVKVLASSFLGLVLCGRINYLLILPVIAFYTIKDKGKYNFLRGAWLLPAFLIFIFLILLFPSALTIPINGVLNRVDSFEQHFSWFLPTSVIGGYAIVILIDRILKLQANDSRFFLSCGIILITPFITASIIELLNHAPLPFTHCTYFYTGVVFFLPLIIKQILNLPAESVVKDQG